MSGLISWCTGDKMKLPLAGDKISIYYRLVHKKRAENEMKKLKKLMRVVVVSMGIICSGCSSTINESLTPVEDSGEKAIGNGISVQLPKGWKAVENALAAEQSGIVITKDFSTVTVIINEVAGLSQYSLDDARTIFEEQLKGHESIGAKIVTSVQEILKIGDAIFFQLENTVTQEMINQNVSSGVYSEDIEKGFETLIGKTIHEAAYYIINGDTVIVIDAVTYNDDAEGIKEVATYIGNNIILF